MISLSFFLPFFQFAYEKEENAILQLQKSLVSLGGQDFTLQIPPLGMNLQENAQIVTQRSPQLLEVIANDSVLLSSLHIFQETL